MIRNSVAALVILSLTGWGLIFWSVANMSSPLIALMMPKNLQWEIKEFFAVWLMWSVMMGAMMLPSAIPMLVVHRSVAAKRDPETENASRWFLLAYLLSWTLFSLTATVLQWSFQRVGVLSQMVRIQDPFIGGGILVAAGVFQLTSLKSRCLYKCRTPIGFLMTDWRQGRSGAFQMGLRHGQYCVGCCWALMIVLFVGGVMNLTAIAVLSMIVAIEKLAPRGAQIAKLGGILLICWGLWLVYAAIGGHLPFENSLASGALGGV